MKYLHTRSMQSVGDASDGRSCALLRRVKEGHTILDAHARR
jgi:hypothetical protein